MKKRKTKNNIEKEIILQIFNEELQEIQQILQQNNYEATTQDIVNLFDQTSYFTVKNDLDSILYNYNRGGKLYVFKTYKNRISMFKLQEKIDIQQILFLILNCPELFIPKNVELASLNENIKYSLNFNTEKINDYTINDLLDDKAKRILEIFHFIKGHY